MHIYSPQPYPGRVTLFKCNERDQLWNERLLAVGLDPYDESLGWQGLSPEPVTVIEIPGHHDVICQDPYVQSLAELLRACIDEAATPASQEQAASLSFNTV
jgi:thioesterase domain-containing protein